MEVGSLGICEKHELPLDARGECELCRLSDMPSKEPPSRAGRWLGLALVVLLLGGGALAFAAFSDLKPAAPERGVPARGVSAPAVATAAPEPPRTERTPSSIPLPPDPPTSGQIELHRVEVAPPPPTPAEEPAQRPIPEEDAKAALSQVKIDMYATQWCGSCRRAREYLSYNDITYTEYDIDEDEAAKERLTKINPHTSIPTFQIDGFVQIGFSPENFEYRLNQAVRKRLD
ncbi:MAG: glutathione S-transferase N-terminal domain-containing protein [Myxococcales bacterium]|nr:glutathione S-transferase N-terminal domain-containing protein [Myxococcales bacterium]MDH3485252.1 glutathione S-transferase N-terminal domain-containing protein [Myxococcales bacterium]